MAESADVQQAFEKGVALHRSGQVAQAERVYRKVLERDENHEQAIFLVAAIAIDSDRSQEAVSLLKRLLEFQPSNAIYLTNLGEAYRRLGEYESAASALVRAVALRPDLVQAHYNLGLVTRKLGELGAAVQAFERAAELKADSAPIQHALARALVDQGDFARAIGHFQCALVLTPNSPDVLTDYAICLRKLKRFPGALRYVERALELTPQSPLAHQERSATLVEQGNFDEALKSSQRALVLAPDFAPAHFGFASALTFNGRLDEGIAAYRKAVELAPEDALLHSNLVFLLAFQRGSSAEMIRAEARSWAERHATPLARYIRPHRNTTERDRKLRVGYVSSNFSDHCQALFTLPLFAKHDRERFELYAYSHLLLTDPVTAQLRSHFDSWSEIAHLDAASAAELIRSHGIDILVDLTMHMSVSMLWHLRLQTRPRTDRLARVSGNHRGTDD